MSKKRKTPKSAPPSEQVAPIPRIWRRPWFPAVVFALLAVAYFHEFPFSDKVIIGLDTGTDFHRGARESIGEKIQALAQPRWGAHMGGYPQYEEIRHQYFPTHLISLFTSHQRHLGWRYLLTMFAAGLGMYAYLRALRLNRWVALWAGVAYMSAPTFLSFPYAGHYAKMAVIALLPFMFLLLERGMTQGRPRHFAGLSVLIGLAVYSPHLQMIYYALWGLGFYFLYKLIASYRKESDLRVALARTGLFAVAVALGLGLGAEGLVPSYLYTKTESKRSAAEDGETGRSVEEQLEYARTWPLHAEEVGSLVVPEFGGFLDPRQGVDYYWGRNGFKLNSEYFGVVVLILALSVLPLVRRHGLLLFMALLFAFGLAFALATPLHTAFFYLAPGARVLRTPGMIAFLFAFAACVMAASGLQQVIEERKACARPLLAAGGSVCVLAALLALAPAAFTDAWISLLNPGITAAKRQLLAASYSWLARGAGYVMLVAAAGTALLYLRLSRRLSTELMVAGLVALTVVDTWRIDRVFLKYEDASRYPDIRDENPRVVEFLRRQEGLFRILPLPDPSYSTLKQQGMHLYDSVTATGSHDFTPRRYDRMLKDLRPLQQLMDARTRGQQLGYSDADMLKVYQYLRPQFGPLPRQLADGWGRPETYTEEALLRAFHPLVDLLNVRYLVTPRGYPMRAAEFPEVLAADSFRLYENRRSRPWFYLVQEIRVVGDQEETLALLRDGEVDIGKYVLLERDPPGGFPREPSSEGGRGTVEVLLLDRKAGQMKLATDGADGPRMLVISENFHPNWHATVDGEEVELYRANYLWMGVPLTAGRHLVELRYRSAAVSYSRVAMGASLFGLLGMGLWDRRRGVG